MSRIIAISGPSGVGKTTISRLLAVILGYKNTSLVSGDDLHRWERKNKNWDKYTHLDPKANDLQLGTSHIQSLKRGISVYRRMYDHFTGKFTEPAIIEPKKTIIYEGLHALYGRDIRKLLDLTIFIDTDKELKREWKIGRDIGKRGYNIEQVLKALKRREKDERKFIDPQKKHADVVIKLFKRDGKIVLEYSTENNEFVPLLEELVVLHDKQQQFIACANQLANSHELVQNKGGNMSYRHRNVMAITQSGLTFDNVSMTSGYIFVDVETLQPIFPDSDKPSMESSIHKQMTNCVLHTHPVYVLCALCAENSRQILDQILTDDIEFVEYYNPGSELSDQFPKGKSIVFAKNHGLFVSSDSLSACYDISHRINRLCKEFFNSLRSSAPRFLFPDAAILEKENKYLHSYVERVILESGFVPDYITKEKIEDLFELEDEKYRMTVK